MAEWILRTGSRRAFRYEWAGRLVRDARTLERIRSLVIPPAWTDVHIAASASHAVQAWGIDARERKQYRYHSREVARGQLRKYYRVRDMAKALPEIRRRVREHARAKTPTKQAAAAAVVRLISESFFRVGSERYLEENKTFGISTLNKQHVELEGDVAIFTYRGKRSITQRQVVPNRELARLIRRYVKSPGRRLFRYQEHRTWHDLTARDVNGYLQDVLGVPFSAKDFRTWGGTLRAATVLAELGPAATPTEAKRNVATTMRLVAAELGNTPAICRKSYVHPLVVARYVDDGEAIRLPPRYKANAAVYAHSPEERALIRFLDRHFPERRKRRRLDS